MLCQGTLPYAILVSSFSLTTLMSATPLAPDCGHPFGSQSAIWIPPTDPRGAIADPVFAEAAYQNQEQFLRYRADELTDEVTRAELLEAAVFRASKAKKKAHVKSAAGYLFRTYIALVDEAISGAVRLVNTKPALLEYLGSTHLPQSAEEEITGEIYRQELLAAIPEDARWLWERRILGFSFEEIGDETGVAADTLNMRARRGAKEAFRRLFGRHER
jgi:DNA-directed RNA polymerase specialized sigma24 family protein